MEYYQAIQNRAGQTAAVIAQYLPTLEVAAVGVSELLTLADALDGLAQTRDNALTDYDAVRQGGVNGLQLLVSYENGTYTSGATSTVEWMVEGVDTEFSHTAPADPSGNALSPFTIGQVVKLRTRVTNTNGTTTGSIRR